MFLRMSHQITRSNTCQHELEVTFWHMFKSILTRPKEMRPEKAIKRLEVGVNSIIECFLLTLCSTCDFSRIA